MKAFLAAAALAACLAAVPAYATTVSDPAGDIEPTYAGPPAPDLDALSFSVDIVGGNFVFNSTMNGAIGTTPNGVYVIGVDRGGASALFAPNKLGVLFNSVIVLNPAGGSFVVAPVPGGAPVALNAGAFTFSGDSFEATVPIALLPSSGFTPDHYGFNLWPRIGGGDFTNIADFVPNDGTVAVAPEPQSWALAILGFGLVGVTLRRGRRAPAPA